MNCQMQDKYILELTFYDLLKWIFWENVPAKMIYYWLIHKWPTDVIANSLEHETAAGLLSDWIL